MYACRLEKGTTYNSYLIFGEDFTALVDASHEKFRGLYLKTLADELKKAGREKIDYIIVSHTEPDHSGLITDLVKIYPDVVVAGSKVCTSCSQGIALSCMSTALWIGAHRMSRSLCVCMYMYVCVFACHLLPFQALKCMSASARSSNTASLRDLAWAAMSPSVCASGRYRSQKRKEQRIRCHEALPTTSCPLAAVPEIPFAQVASSHAPLMQNVPQPTKIYDHVKELIWLLISLFYAPIIPP
jgi:hypothetical protein